MKNCFIVCPINNEGSETRKRSDDLLNYVLKPVCKECELNATRVDELNSPGSITQTIIDNLISADLVIADLTEHNPNAFYELGYRTALNKPLIQIKKKNEQLPFDVNSINTFDYDLTDLASIENFKNRLKTTIKSFNFNTSSKNTISDNPINENFNSIILQEIYKLQDMINKLLNKSIQSDTSAISVLADKLAQINTKSPEASIIETIFPILMKNPQSIEKLIELSSKLKQ